VRRINRKTAPSSKVITIVAKAAASMVRESPTARAFILLPTNLDAVRGLAVPEVPGFSFAGDDSPELEVKSIPI
jgi:hypothetical protein